MWQITIVSTDKIILIKHHDQYYNHRFAYAIKYPGAHVVRIGHFESLKPVCPLCKTQRQVIAPLTIANVALRQDDIIVDGNLACTAKQCRMNYPIIDGIPIIMSQLRKYLNDNFYHITVRSDLSWISEALLGDAAGPGAMFNNMRHYLSTYCWDHYADKAPAGEFDLTNQSINPSNIAQCINAGLKLIDDKPKAPMLDIGCAVGRSTFEVASKSSGLTLGIDMNFSLLRVAQRILREGTLSFPLKRVGLVYDRHEYKIALDNKDAVDFWACDALALPFENESFHFASALNVFDAVNSPRNLLISIRNMLAKGGYAIFATPYDWCASTPVDAWIGGHSQLGDDRGGSETLVRKMLTPDQHPQSVANLTLVGEIEHHPWNLRIHNRHTDSYETHIVACQKN